MNEPVFILKGNLIFTSNKDAFTVMENGYLVVEDGEISAVRQCLTDRESTYPLYDYGDRLIIPGFVDLHTHAPQFPFRGLGMDMELLEWLAVNTFPEEAKYADLAYARQSYEIFVKALRESATTSAVIFATVHRDATLLLMDMLEQSGLRSLVGKVNMDRNAPDYLAESSASWSASETLEWIRDVAHKKYRRTEAILTPRFIPSCSDELMESIKQLQLRYDLPVQSHLSENLGEIQWVKELCPESEFYGDAYDRFGLFGADCRTVMAHCVHSGGDEIERMRQNGVFIAHCPESNINVCSGIAPIRDYLDAGMHVGLGTDVAAGSGVNMFSAMAYAVQSSKMRKRLCRDSDQTLRASEAFYMATKGGGAFLGSVGSFENGYKADIVVLDDSRLAHPQPLTIEQRLERMMYMADEREVYAKYVDGRCLYAGSRTATDMKKRTDIDNGKERL